jgi:hypothetical protein
MEQRTVIRFPTLKGLRASAIAVELELVYETEVLALYTVKNGVNALGKGELRFAMTQSVEDPLATTWPNSFPLY